MPLMIWATHALQWVRQKAKLQSGGNPKTNPQFRLQAETRLHEVGIASNRRSERCGEYVPGPCTHRPSHHPSWEYLKSMASRPATEAVLEGRLGEGGEVVTR